MPFPMKPRGSKKAPAAKKTAKAKPGMINPGMPKPKGGNVAALREAQFSRMQKGY